MTKKILTRLAALAILLWGLNQFYTHCFYPSDLKKIALADSLKNIQDTCSIIYLGESSNFSFSWKDTDKRRISDMVADYYPGLSLGTLNKGALHAGIYLRLLQQIPSNSKVETIIVTMNLRSFGADWIHSKLESVLQRDILLLSPGPKLWNRFRMGLKAYYNPSEYKRKSLQQWHYSNDLLGPAATYPTSQAWIDAVHEGKTSPLPMDSASRSLAATFIRLFAFRIDTLSNPRIKDFDQITHWAQKRGWNLIFNLLSENLEKARQLTGDALPNLMMQNRDLLVKRYTRMGAIVVDNLSAVDSSLFIDKNWPTEHYTETGRKKIARNIARTLQSIYPAQYEDVRKKTHFYTDFERPTLGFASAHTNTKKALSGKHSIALHKATPYSPAFYLNFDDTDITCPFTLSATAYYNGMPQAKDLKMVITLDKKENHILYSVAYPSQKENEEWKKIENKIHMPHGIQKDELLSAYCWYTGADTIYIDNFSIDIIPADSIGLFNFARHKNSSPKPPLRP